MFAAFLTLAGRAFWLQGMSTDFLQKHGASRYARTLELPAIGGKILDRNGQVLASSLPVKAVWVIADDVLQETAGKLRDQERLLDMSERSMRAQLDSERNFVYQKWHVELGKVGQILQVINRKRVA